MILLTPCSCVSVPQGKKKRKVQNERADQKKELWHQPDFLVLHEFQRCDAGGSAGRIRLYVYDTQRNILHHCGGTVDLTADIDRLYQHRHEKAAFPPAETPAENLMHDLIIGIL